MSDTKAQDDAMYEQWVYTARDEALGFPWTTHMLYKVANNDPVRFEEGERLLRIAFIAGRESMRNA